MKKQARKCQNCGKPALSRRRAEPGQPLPAKVAKLQYRDGHDLCESCFAAEMDRARAEAAKWGSP